MIREALNQWDFVIAAYAIMIPALIVLTLWSWRRMVVAERKRDEARGK